MYSHHSTSAVEQVAVEAAPKLLDPIQQTIATILRSYINSPTISRKEIMGALQLLTEPQPGVYIKELRKAYETFLANNQIEALIAAVKNIAIDTATTSKAVADNGNTENKAPVKREDLRLVCFDYVMG
ncbi:MAG TPA: hypothetical protein VEU97_02855 [Ktedonobacteraceae bacterium]|nr:hypothetical protein [Ktedonobacteraceae bacterium]